MCPVVLLSAENPASELLLLKYSLRYAMGSFMNLLIISLHPFFPLILEFFFGIMNILVFSEKSSVLKIEIDAIIVAEHGILTGTGRISRKKEHFEGLLKAVREENSAIYEQRVEERNLKTYDGVI